MSRVDFVGGKPRGAIHHLSFLCRHPPLPPLEIQISRFTRPNGILPFSREHLPEYAPQSSELRSIRSASCEVAENGVGEDGAREYVDKSRWYFLHLPLFLALFDGRHATGLSDSSRR